MNIDIKYNSLHKYLLSFFTLILIIGLISLLSPIETIHSKLISFIIIYSIIGVICSVLAWSKIEGIYNEAKGIRFSGLYHPVINDEEIQKKLSESQGINNYLFAVLLIFFFIMIIAFMIIEWVL